MTRGFDRARPCWMVYGKCGHLMWFRELGARKPDGSDETIRYGMPVWCEKCNRQTFLVSNRINVDGFTYAEVTATWWKVSDRCGHLHFEAGPRPPRKVRCGRCAKAMRVKTAEKLLSCRVI